MVSSSDDVQDNGAEPLDNDLYKSYQGRKCPPVSELAIIHTIKRFPIGSLNESNAESTCRGENVVKYVVRRDPGSASSSPYRQILWKVGEEDYQTEASCIQWISDVHEPRCSNTHTSKIARARG